MAEGNKVNANAVQQCVQCKAQYKEAENSNESCKFHLVKKWTRRYTCCDTNGPGCQSNKHRAKHHTDYQYAEFWEAVSKILANSQSKQWVKIEAMDLEKNKRIYASVNYVFAKALGFQNSLCIVLNSYSNFIPFSLDTIKNFGKTNTSCNDGSNRALIKEITDDATKASVKAEWAFKDKTNEITGVYLSIQTKTSSKSESVLVKFSTKTLVLELDEVVTISKSEFTEYRPSKPYHDLIKDIAIKSEGAALKEEKKDDANNNKKKKKNWKAYGSLATDLMVTQKEFISNRGFNYSGDRFALQLTFMNKCADKDFVFTEIEGIYQLNGDNKWSEFDTNNSKVTVNLPFTIKKGRGETMQINVELWIPYADYEKQPKPESQWRGASYLARFRSLNIKLKFKDLDDRSLLFETMYKNDINYRTPRAPSKDTVYHMTMKESISCDRLKFNIELDKAEARNPDKNNTADKDDDKKDADVDKDKLDPKWSTFNRIKICGPSTIYFDVDKIRSMVYKAIKEKQTIIKFDTKDLNRYPDIATYNAFGYIDATCNRLYGIKLVLTTKSERKTGFYILPIYGRIYDVDVKDPLLVTDADEIKYFKDTKQCGMDLFKMNDIVGTYFDIKDNILTQKIQTRDTDLNDFQGDVASAGGSGGNGALQQTIQQQAQLIANLQKQLIGGGGNIDYSGTGGMNLWTNNVATKFEQLAQLFRSFPGNNSAGSTPAKTAIKPVPVVDDQKDAKPVTKPVPVAKAVVKKDDPKPVAKPVPKPVVKPVVKPVIKPVAKPVAKPAVSSGFGKKKIDVSKIFGKIQIVNFGANYKVQIDNFRPDLKVQKVNNFANKCGKWQIVKFGAKYKIQIVKFNPDFKIKYVNNFPGLP